MHQQLLEKLTGKNGWQLIDGPDSGVGVDHWFSHPDGSKAYVNDDQGFITLEVDGEVLFKGEADDE